MTEDLQASLRVDKIIKNIQIIGDRVCRYQAKGDPLFTEPEPFVSMKSDMKGLTEE